FTLGHLALHHGLSTIPPQAARFVDKFAGRATGFVDKSVDHFKGQRLWLSRSEEPEAPPVLRSHQRVVDALGSSGRFCARRARVCAPAPAGPAPDGVRAASPPLRTAAAPPSRDCPRPGRRWPRD